MKSYNIIYELLDDMRAAMEGRLAPSEERVPLGKAEVRAVFGKGSKLVAGCMVTDGQLRSESFITVSGGKAVMSVLLWHAHGVICQGRGRASCVQRLRQSPAVVARLRTLHSRSRSQELQPHGRAGKTVLALPALWKGTSRHVYRMV